MKWARALAIAILVTTASVSTAGDRDKSLALAQESHALYRAERYAEAAELLERAYAFYPEPVLLYNLGKARQKNGQLDLALVAYRRYLAIAPPDARDVPDAQTRTLALDAELHPPPPVAKPVAAPAPAVFSAPAPIVTSRPRTPLYRRWWLWTTVGVVVAGAALGVGLGVGLSHSSYPTAPAGTTPVSF